MTRIAIAGVGLIGASFALAVRKAGFSGEVVGVSSSRSIEAGIRAGAISRGVSLREAASSSDFIYLSQPIEEILKLLPQLGPLAKKGCLITDAGSTKSAIVEAAGRHVSSANFLGGHPMAGKESRGAESADADLFRGRPYVLTPTAATGDTGEFRLMLEGIGAHVYEMSPAEHDATVAFTSHLPQLLSTALAATLDGQKNHHLSQVFGPGLIDMTRLALSAPELWMSVLRTNRQAVKHALGACKSTLDELERKLESDDLDSLFQAGSRFSQSIRT